MPWTRSRLKIWWPKSGFAGREWNGKEEEASQLKSTLIVAAPPEAERSHDEERRHAMSLRNASAGGRAASPRLVGLGSGPLAWRRREGVGHWDWLDDPKAVV